MSSKMSIPQRIRDFRAFCASNRIQYKEVTDAANLNYDSVIQNMRLNMFSNERMTLLEQTAIQVKEEKEKQEA
jgi:hypothetical protein